MTRTTVAWLLFALVVGAFGWLIIHDIYIAMFEHLARRAS